MRKKVTFFLILAIILSFFASCGIKQQSSPPIKNTGQISSEHENIYSLPETPSIETQPLSQTEPLPTPPPVPEVKTEAPKPIGTYQTAILNRDNERMENIRLAVKKTDGYKLKPGETFSFNKIVGKRDSANGFKVAAVIINGDYGEDMGGGVCQVSSTIFNAADKAGLQIIERHSHSRAVKYVPAGRDAAVSYDYLDLKFKNNKNYTVQIKLSVEGTKLRASIYKAT